MTSDSWKNYTAATVAIRKARNGGSLEINIDEYNERIRSTEDLGFSRNRMKADRLHDEQQAAAALKEVWDE